MTRVDAVVFNNASHVRGGRVLVRRVRSRFSTGSGRDTGPLRSGDRRL